MGTTSGEKSKHLSTGVAGLDVVLHGGLLRGAMYLVMGGPGTGKTVLSSQVSFHRATVGENVVYVTTFSESHGRLLSNLESFGFFDRSLVQSRLTMLSAVAALEEGGLKRFQTMIGEAVRAHHASLLVIDSLNVASELAPSPFAYRKFLRELGTLLSIMGCTALLVMHQGEEREMLHQFAADGILMLDQKTVGMRLTRELLVLKLRGSAHLGGQHVFDIGDAGVTVHPRRETLLLKRELAVPSSEQRSRFGIRGLDDMLEGGVSTASMTALVGAPGSGKTLLGLHMLAEGLRLEQPSLYFGFYETPPRLLSKAEGVGLGLREYVESGLLEVQWRQPAEQFLDSIAEQLLEVVYRNKVKRLFLDGIDGMLQAVAHPERFPVFFTALSNELRMLGVTSVTSMETSFGASERGIAPVALSTTVENIIFVRYVELRSQLHRLISILKVRESNYDPSIREFRITSKGLEVASTFESAEAVLDQMTSGGQRAHASGPPLSHSLSPPEGSGEDV
jgi:circadian clock protein KaiC